MKKFSEDIYSLRSELEPGEITERLADRTLKRKHLAMVHTEKDFIGRIHEDTFSIFEARFLPYGAACVLHGIIGRNSEISLVATLHPVFRILFTVWMIVISGIFVFGLINNSGDSAYILVFVVFFPIMAALFRLFMHVMYVLARNKAILKLREVLQIVG